MKIARCSSILSIMLVIALASCAPQTEVIKLYDNSARAGQVYERLLVISVAGDTGSRRRLKELISEHLESANVAAIVGYTETGLKTNLLQEEIDTAARNANADAILISHIVSVDTRVDVDTGRTDILSECRGGDPLDYFLYDHRELKELLVRFEEKLSGLEADVFRLRFKEEMEQRAIAEKLGCSLYKMRSVEARLRKLLLNHLKDTGYLASDPPSPAVGIRR